MHSDYHTRRALEMTVGLVQQGSDIATANLCVSDSVQQAHACTVAKRANAQRGRNGVPLNVENKGGFNTLRGQKPPQARMDGRKNR